MEVTKCTEVYLEETPPTELPPSQVTGIEQLMTMLMYSVMAMMVVNIVSSIGEMVEG